MKYKPFVYTPIILIITTFEFLVAGEEPTQVSEILQRYNHRSKLEQIFATTNATSETFHQKLLPLHNEVEDAFGRSAFGTDFPSEINQCLLEHRHQITENFVQGKHVILNCFKATLMLKMLRYLGESPKGSIKLLDGMVEIKKLAGEVSDGCGEGRANCDGKYERNFESSKKNEYIRMYKKAMQKLINERKRFHAYRNQTQEEKAAQLERINRNTQAFMSEVIRTLGDENIEREEEEKLKKEITDPKLLSLVDTFSRNYMLKLRFYPGVAARMMRSHNGGFTFDLEFQEVPEGEEEDTSSDEGSTREIKDGPQAKDYLDDDDDDDDSSSNIVKKKRKADKKKKKKLKKKAKELKKIIPYLLLPMLIQMTLLPFVFKKLFFLAMKALFAGKMALILIGFNLLRNTCIKNDDDYQKIRVEHYGYRKGEEYGAWINGRSLWEPSVMAALSEEPFRGQNPVRSEASS